MRNISLFMNDHRPGKGFPNSTALIADTGQLSYGELDIWSSQWAHHLMRSGVGVESIVAVFMERSILAVVLDLAILKAGGAFLHLDPSYPPDRLSFMLADIGACLVVADEQLEGLVPKIAGLPVMMAQQEMAQVNSLSSAAPSVGLSPQHRAYLMYTSGSTGKPKGVEICHGGLLNLVHWNIQAYALTSEDLCMQMASPVYDAYIYEMFPCLASGAAAYLIDDVTRTSADQLRTILLQKKITVAFLPTALGEQVANGPWPPATPLRLLASAGEKLMHLPAKPLPFTFLNLYGPTENTVIASYFQIDLERQPPPIGRPVSNVQLYVLDNHLNPVPIGVNGELYIGGSGVARGYFNRPRLTAEHFIPDPFSGVPGGRLYKTNDIVRFLADGNLDFVGRHDHQVKLRGFRIELGEIEKVLHEHPSIKEAVAQLADLGASGKGIVAHVAAHPGKPLTEELLRNQIRKKLPAFMVPSRILILPELPKSVSGKVDRKALPAAWPPATQPGDQAPVHPQTSLEQSIASVWREFLPVKDVSMQENFFDMGGHSLLMAQVHHRLKEKLDKDINLVDLFRYPTIRSLARQLEKSPAIPATRKELKVV